MGEGEWGGGVSVLTLEKQGGIVCTEEQLCHSVCQLFAKRFKLHP